MKITIIAVGKLKEKYIVDAVTEYAKRLSRYGSFSVVELPDEKIPENLSQAQKQIILKKEGARILKSIKDGAYVIATAIEGKELSSEDFAGEIAALTVKGISHICFVIGGTMGLDQDVYMRADFLLSFSKLTFPHQLMRIFLVEQIYRAFKIINNEPYHR